MPTANQDCAEYVRHLTDEITGALEGLVTRDQPASLYGPTRYALESGGKRLRPLLCLLMSDVYGGDRRAAMPMALSVEVFHNFTLVHDDIMDHAVQRRGRPTIHTKWDEADAILAGDLLLGMSYSLLSKSGTDSISDRMEVFHGMVVRLCEGQALDKDFEKRSDVTLSEYLHMISGKTGALIETSMLLGAMAAGAGERARSRVLTCGNLLGRAFQVQDDLLDLTATNDSWGKTVGGDLIEGKKTYLLLTALGRATGDELKWFERIIEDGGLPAKLIPDAREKMQQLGVLDHTRDYLNELYGLASREIDEFPQGFASETLRWFIQNMSSRIC